MSSKAIKVSKPNKNIQGTITLNSSKSICNRVQMIKAFSGLEIDVHPMSQSKDSQILKACLEQDEQEIYDAGAAGTSYRFLTAYLAFKLGSQVLTGTERMKQRPIGILVNALRTVGADIEYLENEGYPPLRLNAPDLNHGNDEITLPADVSSQYISALLMLAPVLPNGLRLTLEGTIVSLPYLMMTLDIMAHFGVNHKWEENTIVVPNQDYVNNPFYIEADWSAASYFYAMAAFSDKLDLTLLGLQEVSLQGDRVIAEMMPSFGIETSFHENSIRITKNGSGIGKAFEWDFIKCPDLAQTLACVCAGTGVSGLFTGLQTLKIKETDRISALKTELAKGQAYFSLLPKKFSTTDKRDFYILEGQFSSQEAPVIKTYEDHRMAMAFAPLAMLNELIIEDPQVVEKSYPSYWDDLQSLGFVIAEMD